MSSHGPPPPATGRLGPTHRRLQPFLGPGGRHRPRPCARRRCTGALGPPLAAPRARAASAGATPADALLVYLHQAALGVIGAGVRAVPIGHTHGQQVLSRLHDDIRDLADELAGRDLDTAGSFCPAYEVLCDAQTHLYT